MFKYLEVLFRHWLRFVLLCAVLPALAGGAGLYLFQGKDGAAQLWVDSPSYIGNVPSASGWNQYLTPAQNAVDSLQQLVETDDFYVKLGQALMDSHTVASTAERDQVLATVRTTLTITSSGSHLVTIKVECRNADSCVQVLTTTIALNREWLIATEEQQAQIASQFYTSQLTQAKERLQAAIDAEDSYLKLHPYPTTFVRPPDPQLDRLTSDVQLAQASVDDLQTKLQEIQFSRDAASEIDQTAVRVIDPPATSGGHFTSGTKKLAAVLAGAAALPGIAYLIFLGWVDRTTRNPKEIEARVGVPVVTTIGRMKSEAA